MAWGKNASKADVGNGVEVFSTDRGVIVEGSPTDVALFIDQMMATTKEAGGQSRHLVVDGVQVAANVMAYRQTLRATLPSRTGPTPSTAKARSSQR